MSVEVGVCRRSIRGPRGPGCNRDAPGIETSGVFGASGGWVVCWRVDGMGGPYGCPREVTPRQRAGGGHVPPPRGHPQKAAAGALLHRGAKKSHGSNQ